MQFICPVFKYIFGLALYSDITTTYPQSTQCLIIEDREPGTQTMTTSSGLRQKVIGIYKGAQKDRSQTIRNHCQLIQSPELLYLGRGYPLGFAYFRERLHDAFASQRKLENPDDIIKGIQRAEYVKKGPPNVFIVRECWLIVCKRLKHCETLRGVESQISNTCLYLDTT